jgi:hypothetical protein
MSMMSSFHVEALLLGMALATGCATAERFVVAPEAPRTPSQAIASDAKPPGRPSPSDAPVEVAEASIRSATAEPQLLQRFGTLPARPEDLLIVDVRTQQPLGDLARSALPVILLNERSLLNTIALDQTRLAALVPVTELGRGEAAVAVTRLGDTTATSRKRFVVRIPGLPH